MVLVYQGISIQDPEPDYLPPYPQSMTVRLRPSYSIHATQTEDIKIKI